MARVYVPYPEKHKWPKGFGSLCPHGMPASVPAELLQSAISVPGVGAKKLWIATSRWCFCAHPSTGVDEDTWHGFPVVGGDVDERVWAALVQQNILSRQQARRLRRQRELPGEWP